MGGAGIVQRMETYGRTARAYFDHGTSVIDVLCISVQGKGDVAPS